MGEAMDYQNFISSKQIAVSQSGFEPRRLSDSLFEYQRHCVEFALRAGRSAMFLDTGLGKTFCQLEYAREVVEHTNRPVLVLTPLAVAAQTARESDKFGIEAKVIREDGDVFNGVNIINYDRLDRLDVSQFSGVILDESSILKNFSGKTRNQLVNAFRNTPYRLACTATPSPNDHTELGNHSEFLGVLNHADMLPRWFINDTMNTGDWRLKGHAVRPFWDWVASWSRCVSKPSDLGFSDFGFDLPDLNIERHVIDFESIAESQGQLFASPELSATGIHAVKKESAEHRSAKVAEMANGSEEPWLIWCDTDIEADHLARLIPDAVEVRGSDKIEHKEESLLGFADGKIRVLITKPSIAGFGMNWQHCNNMAFVGLTYSYESFYQAVRRCWRFGQTKPVNAHLVMTHAEAAIWRNVSSKADSHDAMKREMREAMQRNAGVKVDQRLAYQPQRSANLPQWLRSA
jgi:superfamily II DNA or RNA helicase